MTKILDIQQSIVAANGNVSLAKELFLMLLDDLNLRLEQIESSFQSSNMDALTDHIHKLYGATAYCIVPKLRDCTATLEEKLKKKEYSQIDDLVNKVIYEVKNIIHSGPSYIQEDWFGYKMAE